MKSIKEQYKEIVCGFNDERTENVTNKCVDIADNHSVQFAKWIAKNCNRHNLDRLNFEKLLAIFKIETELL